MRVAPAGLAITVSLLGACDGSIPPTPPLDAPTVRSSPTGGTCAETEVDGATVLRFEADGRCLPGDVMVLYRCTSGSVPVLRLSSTERPTLFLGGPFAAPVTTLPAQVRFAGEAGGTEVLIADPLPAEPSPTSSGSPSPTVEEDVATAPAPEPLVYVRHAGVTERWLRLEGRRALDDLPVVWLIGDSILDGGSPTVATELAAWHVTLDAGIGRSSSSGIEIATAAVEQGAHVVVMELGTNDPSAVTFRRHLVETLEVLEGVPLVIWQTVRGPAGDPTSQEVNAAIREVAPTYPNVAIADWEAFVPAEAVQEDGIHPDEAFLHLEAELLVPMLSEWRDALSREGATSCGSAVVRQTS
ncbi:MAG: hypothetical protein ACRDG8_13485 [Actinomycetota bacterium]